MICRLLELVIPSFRVLYHARGGQDKTDPDPWVSSQADGSVMPEADKTDSGPWFSFQADGSAIN